MNKLLFEQPKLTVEVFSAKEDILLTSGVLGGTETAVLKIPAIGNGIAID